MPNPRLSLQLPKLGQPFVLYRYEGEEIDDRELASYRIASLSLVFAVSIAGADGKIFTAETEHLWNLARTAPGLSPRGRLDLQAHLQWLLAVPPELGSLRSRLAALSPEDRQQLGQIALSAASVDGNVLELLGVLRAQEVKSLLNSSADRFEFFPLLSSQFR
jgi:hypothetical protein